MIFADIQSAIIQRYQDGSFGLTTYVPGRDYTPIAGATHARISVAPARVDGVAVGSRGLDAHVGVFAVDLFYPLNRGTAAVYAIAYEVQAVFQRGTTETYGSAEVWFRAPMIGKPMPRDGWLWCQVMVGWEAHKARA